DLGGSYLFRNYTGIYRTENLAELTTGLTWKLSPTLQTFVRGTFDAFKSSAHNDDYTAATVFAGVRLQR
ncbi:outer membrane beta-barrel protein, partial [Acinetobacter baumannii]